jgi:hypothetical protein
MIVMRSFLKLNAFYIESVGLPYYNGFKGVKTMYHSYSGFTGLLIILTIVFVIFWLIFAAGSFLLGTPIGLAILAMLIVRHFWRRSQYLKAMHQAEADWQQTTGNAGAGFGPFGAGGGYSAGEFGQTGSKSADSDREAMVHDGVDRSEYSAAEDVHYKEIDE